jgi:hypothetical protein
VLHLGVLLHDDEELEERFQEIQVPEVGHFYQVVDEEGPYPHCALFTLEQQVNILKEDLVVHDRVEHLCNLANIVLTFSVNLGNRTRNFR